MDVYKGQLALSGSVAVSWLSGQAGAGRSAAVSSGDCPMLR